MKFLAEKNIQKAKLSIEEMPIAPFLLAIQPIIQLVSLNIDQVLVEEIYLSILVSVLIAVVIFAIAGLIFRSWPKASAVAAMAIISFFSFGELASLVAFWRKTDMRRANLEAMLACILLIGLWGIVVSNMKQPRQANLIFNVMSIIFLGQSLFQLSHSGFQIRTFFDKRDNPLAPAIDSADINVEQPDIYYIILDGYGRQDILEEIYALDNSDFLNSLRSQKFNIASASNSNYIQTFLSVASSLNMTYVQDMKLRNEPITERKQLYEIASNSEVRHLLAERGYRMIAFQNSYSFSMKNADIYYDNAPIRPFYSLFINTTMLRIGLGEKLIGQSYDLHRDTIFFTIDTLKTIPQKPGNYFVFAHILLPHPPFVFKSDCQVAESPGLFNLADASDYLAYHSSQEYIDGYRMQVQCVNRLILDAISEILKNSETPPIIVIQGDHGPGLHLDWESFENSKLYERFGILNAYYFPDQDYGELYPGISPVNSFRVILNEYFNQSYELLPDHSYYSTWSEPFDFMEATFTK